MAIVYPLSLPAAFAVARLEMRPITLNAVSVSATTGQTQIQSHPGEWWEVGVTLPPYDRPDAATIEAFLLSLRGRRGTFLFNDPSAATPRGSAGGTPVVGGAHAARSKTLATTGWPLSQTGVLLAGDYFSVGTGATTRLHKVLNDADSDGAGAMTLDIFPSIREALAASAVITTSSALGTFRLAEDLSAWNVSEALHWGFGFEIVEAI